MKEQIVDLGEGKFMVESEKGENKFYTCDMMSGYCSCPMGINCAPCKHKSAVAKHFKIALFSVAPSMDPKMRAMYHFIALGKVLPSHMYRNLGDCQNEPEIDSYIQNIGKHSKGNCEEDDLPTASSAFDHSENEDDAEDDVSDEEESFDTQLIRRNFSEAFEEYRNKILEYQSSNPQDPSINRAMIAMTKTLRRSMKCLPATIQNQMHNFGKGTIAKNRSKKGGTIKVNSPSLSRRTFKVPGRGPAPQGRPLQDRSGKVQIVVTEDGDMIARSGKALKFTAKKKHNLAKVSKKMKLPPKNTPSNKLHH